MEESKKEKSELDTETTIADMNIEGFKWYNPSRKKEKSSGQAPVKLTRKERIAVMKGALSALLPLIGIIGFVFAFIFVIAYLWLN